MPSSVTFYAYSVYRIDIQRTVDFSWIGSFMKMSEKIWHFEASDEWTEYTSLNLRDIANELERLNGTP